MREVLYMIASNTEDDDLLSLENIILYKRKDICAVIKPTSRLYDSRVMKKTKYFKGFTSPQRLDHILGVLFCV